VGTTASIGRRYCNSLERAESLGWLKVREGEREIKKNRKKIAVLNFVINCEDY
jgi:hypothetical protein